MEEISSLSKIEENVAKVMVGKTEVTKLLLASLVAGGHVLLEDVPGTGKTVLARTLAKSMGCSFNRVQFTPDLLPSDVTGLSFFNQEKGAFTFKEGPVFTNILLADEINRATPRTQSSLLECMAEGQVTVDGETRVLAPPFFVIATQNPVETIGCFPLPEAQLDRFMMKIPMGALSVSEERQMLDRFIIANTSFICVGPPVMIRFTVQEILKLGVPEENIWVSHERKMCCGLGKCGHCRIGSTYICLDGPVFNYVEGKNLID